MDIWAAWQCCIPIVAVVLLFGFALWQGQQDRRWRRQTTLCPTCHGAGRVLPAHAAPQEDPMSVMRACEACGLAIRPLRPVLVQLHGKPAVLSACPPCRVRLDRARALLGLGGRGAGE